MPTVPVLKPREAIAALTALGFEDVRQRGSHKRFRHPDGRTTTVPVHRGRDLSPVILRCVQNGVSQLKWWGAAFGNSVRDSAHQRDRNSSPVPQAMMRSRG